MNAFAAFLAAAGVSQGAFAQQIGVSQQTVSMLARGERQPSLRLALKIERESGGAVPAEAWAPPEAQEVAA